MKADAANGKATLFWSIDRSSEIPISGYKIFLTDSSRQVDTSRWIANPGKPYNSDLYPGDTDSDMQHESISLDNLENGRIYYALVRTVGFDGRESKLSKLISFRPLARGEFVISSNHLASDGGFNFENQEQVPGQDPRSDLYLYSNGSKIGLSSPSRLGAGLRRTTFSSAENNKSETIAIEAGDKISLKTKFGDVDLTVLTINGHYPEISAKLDYVYYPGNR